MTVGLTFGLDRAAPVGATTTGAAHFRPFEVKFADSEPTGTFGGYASVFGNVDAHGDIIEAGAFTASLEGRRRAGRGLPPMYKMHGFASGNEHEPIGLWESIIEDDRGLHVCGRLIGLSTQRGRWHLAQLREGALSGLSIGYSVPAGGGRMVGNTRHIRAATLHEISLVDDPSNALARVYIRGR